MPCGNSKFGDVPSKSFTMAVYEILGYKSCWSLMANFTNCHCLRYRILDCLCSGGEMSVFSFRNTGGSSGEMEISLPFRFFAFCSHWFLWNKSVKWIRISASGSCLRRWQALMHVLPALGTCKTSFASLIQAAPVWSSISLAAPATPLIIRAHFNLWTSSSNWRIVAYGCELLHDCPWLGGAFGSWHFGSLVLWPALPQPAEWQWYPPGPQGPLDLACPACWRRIPLWQPLLLPAQLAAVLSTWRLRNELYNKTPSFSINSIWMGY